MKQGFEMNTLPVLIREQDCAYEIMPREMTARELGLVLIGDHLCPRLTLWQGRDSFTVTFSGVHHQEFRNNGGSITDFANKSVVWFDEEEYDDPEICILIGYRRWFFTETILRPSLEPYMRFLVWNLRRH